MFSSHPFWTSSSLDVPAGVTHDLFFPSILDVHGRTCLGHTGGRSHRIFNPPSFCGACLDFCREKDSAIPFPRRPWSRILCTNELIVLHPLGIFILVGYDIFIFFFLYFCEEKSQFVWQHRDSNSRPNVKRFRGYQLNHRGAYVQIYNSNSSLLCTYYDHTLCRHGHHMYQSTDRPSKVANPARGLLNREN